MAELKVYEAYICSHEFLPEEAPKDCNAVVSSNSRYAKDDWWDNAKEFECYLKSEADKVISEKDKEIQRLENLCESYRIDCDNLAIREANAYKVIERDNKELRLQKYKRCLAMAERCKFRMYYLSTVVDYESSKLIPSPTAVKRYSKKESRMDYWKNRWLELADQFKEGK